VKEFNRHGKVFTNQLLYEAILRDYNEDRRAIEQRKLPEMWQNYEEQYMNEYWKGENEREEHLSEMTSNGLFEVVEAQLPVITSRAPKPDVVLEPIMLAEEELEGARVYAEKVQKELMNVWSDDDENAMQQLVQSGFREHGIKGKFLMSSEYSLRKQKIINEAVDICSIVPDRHAPSIEACHDSHLSHVTYRTPEWVMDNYGVQVEAEGYFDDDGSFAFYSNQNPVSGAVSFAVNKVKNMFSGDSSGKPRGYCLLIKYYCSGKVLLDDPTKEKYQDYKYDDDGSIKKDETGNKMTSEQEREKYPNGRVITIVRGCKNKILRDHANPYERYPFFDTTNFKRAGDFWGTSEGLNIETHTLALNLIMSNVVDNTRYTGNPQRIEVEGSDQEDLPVMPGTTVKTNMPEGVGYLQPPRLQNLSWFIDWLQSDEDRKTGMSDAFRGLADSGDSGVKVQTQISQAVGRLQPKTMEFLVLARKLYKHWIYIIQNFYPEEVIQEVKDEAGESVYEPFNPRAGAHIKLKVKIGNTAMLPADNFSEFDEAKFLFETGMSLFGFPFISPAHLVELAPSLSDKQRAKIWIKEQFAKAEQAMMEEQQAEAEAAAGPQPTEEEMVAMQNAQQAGDKEAILDILAGMKERFMAENAPLPAESQQGPKVPRA